MMLIGMVSFLSASSRTPLTAIMFSVEALFCLENITFVIIGVLISFLVIETANVKGFTDILIENKAKAENEGKKATIVDAYYTVKPKSFAVGKEIRDILWPPTCTVLSVRKIIQRGGGINAGDVLHLHYLTYNESESTVLIENLIGEQDGDYISSTHSGEKQSVPEN